MPWGQWVQHWGVICSVGVALCSSEGGTDLSTCLDSSVQLLGNGGAVRGGERVPVIGVSLNCSIQTLEIRPDRSKFPYL